MFNVASLDDYSRRRACATCKKILIRTKRYILTNVSRPAEKKRQRRWASDNVRIILDKIISIKIGETVLLIPKSDEIATSTVDLL